MWLIETKSKIDSYEAERSRSIKTPDATTTGGATSEIDRKSILTNFDKSFITALFCFHIEDLVYNMLEGIFELIESCSES